MLYEDDAWKRVAEPKPAVRKMTRAELQAEADEDYGMGRISLREWRELTQTLSYVIGEEAARRATARAR